MMYNYPQAVISVTCGFGWDKNMCLGTSKKEKKNRNKK